MRSQGANLSQKYWFSLLKPYGIGIKKYQVLSTDPCSTVDVQYRWWTLDVTGHQLDLNYSIQRNQNDSFTIFADCKNNAMLVKKWVQFLKCEHFKKQGQPSLVIIINMPSWYGKPLYGHLDFLWGFVRSLLFLPKPEIRSYTWGITSIYHRQKETHFYWVWQLKWVHIDVAALLHYASY